MASPIIKLKRGAYADLPTLAVGEPGFTTDRHQLYVGSPTGNQLIGGGEFWNLNSTTVGGGIKVYEATNNGTNSIELRSPSTLASDLTFLLPGADGSSDQVLKTDGSGNLVFANVNSLANAGLNNIVEDTTPQLGGNLDLSGQTIEGSGNIDYTGNLVVSGTASLAGASMTVTTDGISVVGVVTASNFRGNLATTDLTGTITNDQLGGSISDNKLNQITAAGKVAVSAVDIDGATDIGEAIVDADEFIVDNGGTGSNRKTDASRIKEYILGGASGATFSSVVIGSDTTINSSGINVDSGIVTATTFKGNLVGDVTGDLTGQADGADQVKTITSNTNSDHYLTFVDSNNVGATNETLNTDSQIKYNPNTNVLLVDGTVSASFLTLDSTNVNSTAIELNYLDGSTPGTATASNAVVLDSSRDITNINNISVTGTVDGRDVLDDGQAGDNLVTLSGVSRDDTNLGTFTGSTVGDAETIKGAIQDLETSLETVAGGGALAASVAVGATDNNSTHFLSFVADNNTDPTQEQLKTDGDLNYNPSTNTLTATNISGELTGNVTGNVTGDLTGNATSSDTVDVTDASSTNATFYPVFSSGSGAGKTINRDTGLTFNPSLNKLTASTFVGDLTGNADTSDKVLITPELSSSTSHFIAFAEQSVSATDLHRDTGLQYVPSTNTLNATNVAVTGFSLGGTTVTSTATELNVLDGVTAFLDQDDMSSNSDTSIPSQQSVKAYVDTEVAGVAVTFSLAADSGSSDIFQTGQTLTISGTSEEVETAVTDNTITIGLPNDVVVGTSLSSPTIQGTTFKAVDGTTAFSLANSTGKVTTSADLEVQGSSTVQGFTVQGNTQIGDQSSDTVGFTARLNSDLIPTSTNTRNLGSSAIRYKDVFSNSVTGTNFTAAGIVTALDYRGGSITLNGGGNFGGNVDISGNLSVGGSITSINVDDFKSVSPLIEVGLEDLGDGTFQPPSFVTQYSTGIAMWYNKVGVSSANAQAASIFASVKPGGSFRIGFATDVSFAGAGTTDGVGVVNAWADIEAKGIWISDCAGQSELVGCSGGVRNLYNITIDAGSFS